MKHILTVHYMSLDWIPIQNHYIQKFISDSCTHSYIDKVKHEPWPFEFDFAFRGESGIDTGWSSGEHSLKLNSLVEKLENRPDSDILIFLDGDSFPIAPMDDFIEHSLQNYDFVSIVREELGDTFPHPSFACCKLGTWKKYNFTWSPYPKNSRRRNWHGAKYNDVGVKLERILKESNLKWNKLKRTNSASFHPIFFGLYGDLIYHHTAGFRGSFRTRWDDVNQKFSKQEIKNESHKIFDNIKTNNEYFDIYR